MVFFMIHDVGIWFRRLLHRHRGVLISDIGVLVFRTVLNEGVKGGQRSSTD
jgi:hypothetical protein